MTDFSTRRAEPRDLDAMNEVFHEAQTGDGRAPAPLPIFPHEIATGEAWVAAANDGRLLGFGVAIERGRTAFLAELFVRARDRSRGIGRALLERCFGARGLRRATLASEDPRALALYAGLGLEARWPLHHLVARAEEIDPSTSRALEIETREHVSPEVAKLDAACSGRARGIDLEYWRRDGRASFLELRRDGGARGYAVVRRRSDDWIGHLEETTVGPLGVVAIDDLVPFALAAVAIARARSGWIRIAVPEPSPLADALRAIGFHVAESDRFLADPGPLSFDPRCYVPSGGALF